MKNLRDIDIKRNPNLLRDAWCSKDSVLILPSTTPVSNEWVTTVTSSLPENYKHDHFGILTSGSTGTPKLILGSKKRAELLVHEIGLRQNLKSIKSTIVCLPLSYSYSLINQWLWSHINNSNLVITDGLTDMSSLISVLQNEIDSMICFVGSQFLLLEKYIPHSLAFYNVKCVNFAGGRFPQESYDRIQALFPNAEVYHNYGCTEALPRLTIRKANEANDPYILGYPLNGIDLIIDSDSNLKFKSVYSAVAICNDQHIKFIDPEEFIETGDLAEYTNDMKIRLLGRSNDVFKRHGEKISLVAIREKIRSYISSDFMIKQVTDNSGEPSYSLIISGPEAKLEVKSILKCLRTYFTRTHWPLRIEYIFEIPLSSNGKLNELGIDPNKFRIIMETTHIERDYHEQ